jgi:hypothetical protein
MVNPLKLRPSQVYPGGHSKETILKHIKSNGWKPHKFKIPQKGDTFMTRAYHFVTWEVDLDEGLQEPRIIVKEIPGEIQTHAIYRTGPDHD